MDVMIPESEFTIPAKPSFPRSRSVTISLLKAIPTASVVRSFGIE